VTTDKIADNSVTSTKVSQTFMKRVTVTDSTAGHAVGWNPDGGTLGFIITEPAVLDQNTAYVSIEVEGGFDCHVSCQFTGGFSFRCHPAAGSRAGPPNRAELHYIVIELPSHVTT
jgi:hypothetical protein